MPHFLHGGCLLDGDHLTLHLGQLSGCLLVTAHEERSRPEDDDCSGGHKRVFRSLAIPVLQTVLQRAA
jgi:hypothetical protein